MMSDLKVIAPYVVPFILYVALTQLAGAFPDNYPELYAIACLVSLVAAIWGWKRTALIRPHFRLTPAVLVGIVGIALWIPLAQWRPEQFLQEYLPSWLAVSERPGFDPWNQMSGTASVWLFITCRLVGLVVVVPIAEELFWRGFLLRWLSGLDWSERALSSFTVGAFVGVCVMFMLAHSEWSAAIVYCALLNGLCRWRGDLWECVVAHAVTNLTLAVYVLGWNAWSLW